MATPDEREELSLAADHLADALHRYGQALMPAALENPKAVSLLAIALIAARSIQQNSSAVWLTPLEATDGDA